MATFKRHWWLLLLFFATLLPRLNLAFRFLTFFGDIVRDADALWRITEGQLILVGPHIQMPAAPAAHLGPLGYYLILPFLWLGQFRFPELGNLPVVLIDSLGAIALYLLVKKRHGSHIAFLAWFLYAFSLSNVFFGSFYWNPNYGPALTTITLYLIDRLCVDPKQWTAQQLWSLAVVLVALTHFHILFWVFVAVVSLYLLWRRRDFLMQLVAVWLVTYIPYLIVEWQNGFANFKAFFRSVSGSQLFLLENLSSLFRSLSGFWLWFDKNERELNAFAPGDGPLFWLSVFLVSLVCYGVVIKWRSQRDRLDWILLLTCLVSLFAPRALTQQRYWHYLVVPAGIYYASYLFAYLWRSGAGKVLTVLVVSSFAVYNVGHLLGMSSQLSHGGYLVDGKRYLEIAELRSRNASMLAYSTGADVLFVGSPEAYQGYGTLRYSLEYLTRVSGRQVYAPPFDGGRYFSDTMFWHFGKGKQLEPREDVVVDVIWLHLPGEVACPEWQGIVDPDGDAQAFLAHENSTLFTQYVGTYSYQEAIKRDCFATLAR